MCVCARAHVRACVHDTRFAVIGDYSIVCAEVEQHPRGRKSERERERERERVRERVRERERERERKGGRETYKHTRTHTHEHAHPHRGAGSAMTSSEHEAK